MEEARECVANGPQKMFSHHIVEGRNVREAYMFTLEHFGGRLYKNGRWSNRGRLDKDWEDERSGIDDNPKRITKEELDETILLNFAGYEVVVTIDPSYLRITGQE